MSETAAEPTDAPAAITRFDCSDPAQVGPGAEAARRAIEAGECVVLPTDTVYGIGADAFSAAAVQRLLDAKGRGRDMPPPVLIGDPNAVKALSSDVPAAAKALMERYWPGALTVIVKARQSLQMDLGDTDGTVALRVPDHELTRRLLRQTGPLAVSSANRSGQPAAIDCDQAIDQLGDRVSVYLDGGRVGTDGSPPSSIVDFSAGEGGQLLRLGAISLEELREHCPDLEDLTPAVRNSPAEEPADDPADRPDEPADAPAEPADGPDEPVEEPAGEHAATDGPDTGVTGAATRGSASTSRSRFTLQPPKVDART